jgi:hypothetical protein
MSKLGAVFLGISLLTATPLATAATAATEVPHHITQGAAAWGCRDKGDLIDLLFLGLSTSFDNKLAAALADGRCGYFKPGETVTIVEDGGHGIVRVLRAGPAPAAYWTPLRNVE